MRFLRLVDPLVGVLFEDDDIVAVDKPYGIDSHTNEAKKGNEEFVTPGLIELFETQLERKLHIIHRLDRTTTGVIVFGKSLESAKKYQQWFRARETKKTYLFITAAKSSETRYSTEQTILHKGAELEASTDFVKLPSSSKRFQKWEAHPHTGRNHQIRIHGAHVGLPLLGDEKYGGESYPFLCLHNRKIEFPNGVTIESPEPTYFQKPEILEDREFAKAVHEIDRRRRLFKKSSSEQCLRLIHDSKDQERGYDLDQLGSVLSLTWYKEFWSPANQRTFEDLAALAGMPLLVRMVNPKQKEKSGKPRELFIADDKTAPLSWIALDGEIKAELRTDVGQSLGLTTDQRLHREWVRAHSAGKSVLNLYSFTGGYGVAAALGGATEVTLVDTGKAALTWSRKNFEINGIEIEKPKFLNRDSLQFLEQCNSKNQKFDLIICDVPSFSRSEKGVFKIETELSRLLSLLLNTLSPQGQLIFATHHEAFFVNDLRKKILEAAGSKMQVDLSSIQSALDFELPGERVAMKSFLITKL